MSPSLFFAHKLRGSSPRFAPSSIIHISLLLQRPPLPFCLRLPSSQTVLHSFQSPKLLPLLPPSMASTRLMSSLSLPLSYHSHLSSPDPFQIQLVLGCDSHFGEASAGFLQLAYQGSDLLSFQNTSWRPSPEGGSRAQKVCSLFNQDHVSHEIVRKLLNEICPWILLSLLDAGKADLQRQGQSCSLPPSFLHPALRNLHDAFKFRRGPRPGCPLAPGPGLAICGWRATSLASTPSLCG
uniref:MHC class I-like antigen recognition-like domain-containing protein n=1 Tax=Canis lupus familiaris TaxID=9615 RepID=A0A8C0S3Q3_CANLF